MNFNNLTQNKPLLFGIIGGIVLVIVIIVVLAMNKPAENPKDAKANRKLDNDSLELLKTDNIGKALEIQSLLARDGVDVEKKADGSKYTLSLGKDSTVDERDRALLSIVRSGIMDRNVGLEIFDKGDFTSSKEDKRIRLARAIDGELSRLIKKIQPIEDATVFVAIPEQSIFTSMQKPVTATVQVDLPPPDEDNNIPDKLDRDKVRAITNLLMGSIPGLDAKNISITDTNGNVYSSLMSPEDDMMTMLEEKDHYMKNKVISQLDRLLGKGNYVVTVSTYLREAPLEASKVIYNPKQSSVTSAQRFRESLGDKSSDLNKYSSAVSSYIPGGLPSAGDSSSNRNYIRSAEELQYGVGKTQISEVKNPGMVEEISVAVTMDKTALPSSMTLKDLKELIARAASPKVRAENVKIGFSDSTNPILAPDRQAQLPVPEQSGNPWWLVGAIFAGAMIIGLVFIAGKSKHAALKQQGEIDELLERSSRQENLIMEANSRAVKLQEVQEQLQHSITNQAIIAQPQSAAVSSSSANSLQETLADIKGNIVDASDERELAKTLKFWIESTG